MVKIFQGLQWKLEKILILDKRLNIMEKCNDSKKINLSKDNKLKKSFNFDLIDYSYDNTEDLYGLGDLGNGYWDAGSSTYEF